MEYDPPLCVLCHRPYIRATRQPLCRHCHWLIGILRSLFRARITRLATDAPTLIGSLRVFLRDADTDRCWSLVTMYKVRDNAPKRGDE